MTIPTTIRTAVSQ